MAFMRQQRDETTIDGDRTVTRRDNDLFKYTAEHLVAVYIVHFIANIGHHLLDATQTMDHRGRRQPDRHAQSEGHDVEVVVGANRDGTRRKDDLVLDKTY